MTTNGQDPQELENYYLDSASGAFSNETRSKLADVARILDAAVTQSPENGLVLHFHGGLNSRDYALSDIVPRLTKRYLADAKAYPLFFVWESGLKETLSNNKLELLKDPTFRELVKKVTEWTLKKTTVTGNLVVRGSGGTFGNGTEDEFRGQFDAFFNGDPQQPSPPVPDESPAGVVPTVVRTSFPSSLEIELVKAIKMQLEARTDPDFNLAIGKAYNALVTPNEVVTRGAGTGTSERADRVLLSEAAINEMFPPEPASTTRGFFTWIGVAKFVAKLVLAVVARFRNHRDHGLYCTVVEELLRSAFLDLVGSNVWNQMKNDTAESFKPGAFCGTAVVGKLKALQDNNKGFKKLTLVGHSTGAIYICNFLDAAKDAGLTFDKVQVIFLAPAVTCARFAAAIEEHQYGFLTNFRMFAMRDERESQDKLVAILYTRSLLYLVSGLLEGGVTAGKWEGTVDMPLVGMERFFLASLKDTFAGTEAIKTVHNFLQGEPNRTVWSPSLDIGAGLNSNSASHGDFDNDETTLKSVTHLITT
jgi:hypothetical protein